jgi:hypothetical protein
MVMIATAPWRYTVTSSFMSFVGVFRCTTRLPQMRSGLRGRIRYVVKK